MPCITRKQIDDTDDLPREKVPVPEWGDKDAYVWVRALTAKERDDFEGENVKFEGENRKVVTANIRSRLACRVMLDDAGKRLYGDAEAGFLGLKSGAVLDRIFDVARKLSGMLPDSVEQAEKNSGSGPSAASPVD
jgi:hypothetical protein